jgi:predicted ATPase
MRRGTTRAPRATGPFLRRITLLPPAADPAEAPRYPFTVPAFRAGLTLDLASNVTFFVGENGSGKSTLLEAVARACGFHPEGGGRDHHFATRADAVDLGDALKLSWLPKVSDGFFMRAESFYNLASYLDEVGDVDRVGGRRLHEQSHGESFLALFANRFDRGIYLLDEPEAALSPRRQLSFLKIIHDLDHGGRAQFLIASHSPILLAYPGATLLSFDGAGVQPIDYRQTDHYTLTKQFLDAPERFFRHLFAAADEGGEGDEDSEDA